MKALIYSGIGNLEARNIPTPKEEFIVRVLGSGVCGTDLKAYTSGHHLFKPPTILRHEFYGSVYRSPKGCEFKENEIVVVAPYCEYGKCEICLKLAGQLCKNKTFVQYGAFCEFVGISPDYWNKGVFRVNKNDDVYTLVEPLACAINGKGHLKLLPIVRFW